MLDALLHLLSASATDPTSERGEGRETPPYVATRSQYKRRLFSNANA